MTFLGQARALAERGIAPFIFDKRGAGQSEGEWITANLDELAADLIAAAEVGGGSKPDAGAIGLFLPLRRKPLIP